MITDLALKSSMCCPLSIVSLDFAFQNGTEPNDTLGDSSSEKFLLNYRQDNDSDNRDVIPTFTACSNNNETQRNGRPPPPTGLLVYTK